MNDTIKKFRSAVGGYNKEDVNTYIKEMDLTHLEAQNTLEKQIAELTAQQATLSTERNTLVTERDTLVGEKDELQRQLEQQAAQLTTFEEDNKILQQKIAALSAQMAAQEKAHSDAIHALQTEKAQAEEVTAALQETLQQTKKQLTEQQDLLAQQKKEADEQIADLHTALEKEKAKAAEEIERFKAAFNENEDSVGYKIRMYDRISGQVGDILLGANRDADDILNDAKKEAEQLRSVTEVEMEQKRSAVQAELDQLQAETKAEAVCIRKKLSETAETLLADISGEMHLNIENCLKELATCMTEVESDTETLLQTTQRRYQEMNERIQYYQSCMQEHLETRLTEMDKQYGIPENRSDD